MNSLDLQNDKNPKFVIDKIKGKVSVQFDTNSLKAWFGYYYEVHVKGAPEKTEQAKMSDLTKFIQFFEMEVGHDQVDSWTPAVSKQFLKSLTKTISPNTQKPGLGSNGTANRLKDYIGLLISIIRYVSFYRIVNCEVVQVFSLNTDR
ncbi:TPA: hypothetical protein NHK01_002530 [Legionella pneumophila]|nr:hypothetical protein [Legionella pneumophila]HCE5647392.1 hypothetical protein [Legionella pneumophila]